MNSPADILLVTQEPTLVRTVANALNVNGQLTSRGVCRTLDDLIIALDRLVQWRRASRAARLICQLQ